HRTHLTSTQINSAYPPCLASPACREGQSGRRGRRYPRRSHHRLGPGVTNTYEEARALAQWAATNGANASDCADRIVLEPASSLDSRQASRTGMPYKLGTNQRRTPWRFDVSAEVDCGREPLDLWPMGSNRRHFGRGSGRTGGEIITGAESLVIAAPKNCTNS